MSVLTQKTAKPAPDDTYVQTLEYGDINLLPYDCWGGTYHRGYVLRHHSLLRLPSGDFQPSRSTVPPKTLADREVNDDRLR